MARKTVDINGHSYTALPDRRYSVDGSTTTISRRAFMQLRDKAGVEPTRRLTDLQRSTIKRQLERSKQAAEDFKKAQGSTASIRKVQANVTFRTAIRSLQRFSDIPPDERTPEQEKALREAVEALHGPRDVPAKVPVGSTAKYKEKNKQRNERARARYHRNKSRGKVRSRKK